MLTRDIKDTIKYSIDLDIISIRTFKGHQGSSIIEIITDDPNTMTKISNYCKNIADKCDISHSKKRYLIHCIFSIGIFDSSQDSYQLK